MSTTGHESEAINVGGLKASLQKMKTDIVDLKYVKPSTGIPKSDLASDVQTSLGKADTALQTHQDISGKADKSATVSTVTYDTTNRKLTKTINGTTTDVVTALKIAQDAGALLLNPIELSSLSHDYTFKQNDCIMVGSVLYKCTVASTTKPPFNFVFDANNKIVVDRINGVDSVVCDSLTLNTGWEAFLDINDRYYTEQRIESQRNYTDALRVDMNNTIGSAYGICATAGATAAKTVSVTNFRLAVNRMVSILFTNGFGTTNSTLNVSGSGAKPIMYFGSAVPPGKVRNNTLLTLQYDGTNWNVISIESLAGQNSMAVDLGLPSGLLWCDRNLGASAPEAEGSYFTWGGTTPHTKDVSEYWYSEPNYNESSAASITQNLSLTYDAARVNLGSPWRMPSKSEMQELIANCNIEQFYLNGKKGWLLTSKINGNTLFFPEYAEVQGVYTTKQTNIYIQACAFWLTDFDSSSYANALLTTYQDTTLQFGNPYRYSGLQIRPVM